MSEWLDPAWRSAADAWIGEQLDRGGLEPVGGFVQVHDRPWSTVIRVSTQIGNVFFKAGLGFAASRGGAHRAPIGRGGPTASRRRSRSTVSEDGCCWRTAAGRSVS